MINVIQNNGIYEIWTDTEAEEKDGRCLASHMNKRVALDKAAEELKLDLATIKRAVSELDEYV